MRMRKRMQMICTRREVNNDLYETLGEEDPAAD